MKNALRDFASLVGDTAVFILALVIAAGLGKAGADPWWLLVPGTLVGYAADNIRRQAVADRDRHYAELMFQTFALGDDKTITVEHFHSSKPRDGGAA